MRLEGTSGIISLNLSWQSMIAINRHSQRQECFLSVLFVLFDNKNILCKSKEDNSLVILPVKTISSISSSIKTGICLLSLSDYMLMTTLKYT